MKIELHVIQSFGPNCLNRDATNSPKDCEFGGFRRARISSQCFKRAMRVYFRAENLVPVGERTKRVRHEVAKHLTDLQQAELVDHAIDAFLDTYYSKNDGKKPEQSAVLLFLSQAELETIAQCIRDCWADLEPVAVKRRKQVEDIQAKKAKGKDAAAETEDEEADSASPEDGKFKGLPKLPKPDKTIVKKLEDAALSSDIALFGRMLAEHTEHRIEAATQVAHAISTHATTPELDFFSAVDDLNQDDAGAGMLGVTGFNAACFYRYALVDIDLLRENLGDDEESTLLTARAFLQAFVHALPTGKQNSMAAQSLPSLGFFVVREGGSPISLVNAFSNPVKGEKTGVLDNSVAALAKYWEKYTRVYSETGIVSKSLFCLDGEDRLGGLLQYDSGSVDAAIETAIAALKPNPASA